LQDVLESAGFLYANVEAVALEWTFPDVAAFLDETLDLSMMFARPFRALDTGAQDAVVHEIEELAAPFRATDGSIKFPGSSLVASARA
jgi:hypothetical protein